MIPIPVANGQILTAKVSNDILKEIIDNLSTIDDSKEANQMPICTDYPLEKLDSDNNHQSDAAYDKTRGLIINNDMLDDGVVNFTIPRETLVEMLKDILPEVMPNRGRTTIWRLNSK